MDGCDLLTVRFHFNGHFVRNSNRLFYDAGTQAISYIDRDKLSLPEVFGHLCDHCNVKEGTMLHWLFPGRDMSTGLRALVDDNVCQYMSSCTPEDGVADVYVENHEQDATEEASECDEEMEDNLEDEEIEDEEMAVREIELYSSPKKWKEEAKNIPGETGTRTEPSGEEKSDTDSDYMTGDSCSSGDDEEADQIYRKFKDLKKKFKRGEATSLDDALFLHQSSTIKSSTSGTKRNSTSNASTTQSTKKAKSANSKNIIRSSAHARVSTIPSGSATLNLQARVPTSNANCSVHVQLSGGAASAHVSAQEPTKSKRAPKRSAAAPLLMLGPWQSDKL